MLCFCNIEVFCFVVVVVVVVLKAMDSPRVTVLERDFQPISLAESGAYTKPLLDSHLSSESDCSSWFEVMNI